MTTNPVAKSVDQPLEVVHHGSPLRLSDNGFGSNRKILRCRSHHGQAVKYNNPVCPPLIYWPECLAFVILEIRTLVENVDELGVSLFVHSRKLLQSIRVKGV